MQAVFMTMVMSGDGCGVLQNYCHAPPYRLPSRYEGVKESRGSKGWCMSLAKRENVRLSGLTGKRLSHRNLPKPIHGGWPACVTGNCSSVPGPESGKGGRMPSVSSTLGVKLGKRNQARKERSWVKCQATGASGESQKHESGSWGYGLKQSEARERSGLWKDGRKGEVGEQGGSEQLKQPHEAMPRNAISNSEYEKVEDLRFSGDMWEGDSGPEVLDLQRALYWFGYLSKRTELTAYFGAETKKALQQFQIAHRVACTGAWGSSSRQALWKVLNEESRSFSEGGSGVRRNVGEAGSSLTNGVNAGGTDVGIRVSELVNNMGAHSLEFISSLSSAPCWRHLPTNVPRNAAMFGVVVGMLAALFGVGYSVVGMLHGKDGQAVRRRVLRAHWRDDLSGTTSIKPKRQLDMFPGLDSPVVEGDYKYRLRSRWRPSSTNGTGRTDRLILYEGQVVVGDEESSSVHPFLNGSASRRDSGKSASEGSYRARTGSNGQVSRKAVGEGSMLGAREENFQGSGMGSNRRSSVRIPGSKTGRSSNSGGNGWQGKDEEDFKDRVQELRKSVQAAEKNRQAAMRALAEERQRSLELQVKISRQKETAAALEEEVRVLKESHDALLASLRKKYSSSVAARAAAALLYQNWDTNYEEGSPQTISD